jgi:hypothetical protein
MANVILAFEALKGRREREMRVTEHRRKLEFADMMRYLLDDLSTQRPSESAWW